MKKAEIVQNKSYYTIKQADSEYQTVKTSVGALRSVAAPSGI